MINPVHKWRSYLFSAFMNSYAEAHLEPIQTYQMKLFAKIVTALIE